MSPAKPVVVFDLDQTISDGSDPPHCVIRPGMREWISSLVKLGYDVRVWTRSSLDYAERVVSCLGFEDFVTVHRKPDWSEGDGIGRETAERILGTLPVLQVDDWEGERIAEVPFQLVEAWDGQALSGWETDDPAPGSSEGSSS